MSCEKKQKTKQKIDWLWWRQFQDIFAREATRNVIMKLIASNISLKKLKLSFFFDTGWGHGMIKSKTGNRLHVKSFQVICSQINYIRSHEVSWQIKTWCCLSIYQEKYGKSSPWKSGSNIISTKKRNHKKLHLETPAMKISPLTFLHYQGLIKDLCGAFEHYI